MGAPFFVFSLVVAVLALSAGMQAARTPAERMRPPGKWFWAAWPIVVPAVALIAVGQSDGVWAATTGKTGSIGDIMFGAPDTPREGVADRVAGTYGVSDVVLWFLGAGLLPLLVFHAFAPRYPRLREQPTRRRVAGILVGLVLTRLWLHLGMSGGFLWTTILLAGAVLLVWLWTMYRLLAGADLVRGTVASWLILLVGSLGGGVAVGLLWTGDHTGRSNLLFWLGWAGIPLAGLAVFHLAALTAPALRDLRVIRIVSQAVLLFGIVAVLSYLADNLLANLQNLGISTRFESLEQPTGFVIQNAPFRPPQPLKEAFVLLVRNTFAVVIVALPLTLLLGTLLGIMRLSSNWLMSRVAMAYVEIFRNIPVVVVIIFLSKAIILPLPARNDAWTPFDLAFISNNSMAAASFVAEDNAHIFNYIVFFSILLGLGLAVWRTRLFNRTGTPHHRVLWFLGGVLSISTVAFFALGDTYSLSRPALDGFAVEGGFKALAPYVALTFGLIIYTSSHVAEIVRGSILAVPKGQTEAAQAVALSGLQRYRYVVFPQAMRIAVPSLINQGLNLTKNSSLAMAVGYAEITFGVFTAIGNANPAPQLLLILMAVYLTFSLSISVLGNAVNRRLQLVAN